MFGQYTLHNKIGSGGYSTVYKCTDQIGIRYACKVMPKEKNKIERVAQEVNVMKALVKSPKIVRFIEAGEDENAYYIIQEWCRGGSVQSYIKDFPNYGENTVASIIRGVLRALFHMHDLGIAHCDVKAGNVFVGDKSEDADIKLGDLGTAVFTNGECIEINDLVGTPNYMAPENLSQKYHTSSDIWSLGVMTYNMLTGIIPFDDHSNPLNPSLAKIWKSILFEEPKMTGSRWKGISDDAKDFVHICLHKSYTNRPDALMCLNHPWLTKTDINDRFQGTPLSFMPFIHNINARTIESPIDLVDSSVKKELPNPPKS